jgi:phospholipase C
MAVSKQWWVLITTAAPILVLTTLNPTAGAIKPTPRPGDPTGGKIQHVVIIMQENRSFDHYFGTYPGADGLPTDSAGNFTTCEPDPVNGGCIKPYFSSKDLTRGGPHGRQSFLADVDNGAMDGFVKEVETINQLPGDVMSYYDARVIPNYWKYAQNYVLQDQLFESVDSWSLPSHLFLVANWSANCTTTNPMSCKAGTPPLGPGATISTPQAYTDETYLLDHSGVSWGYFVTKGTEPDCLDGQDQCRTLLQSYKTPGYWNPLPQFTDVQSDRQVDNVQSIDNFYTLANNGMLPNVSWVQPNNYYSEHGQPVSRGQAFVTSILNTVMTSPDWASTAIFVSWDDWGGFYDHVVPPRIDSVGYGLRVPGLVISPWVKPGYIDHQTLSQDAYNKFIEDVFLGGKRVDPKTDGRPDPRPDVRETLVPGDLINDFDFSQTPLPKMLLPLYPKPGPASKPGLSAP